MEILAFPQIPPVFNAPSTQRSVSITGAHSPMPSHNPSTGLAHSHVKWLRGERDETLWWWWWWCQSLKHHAPLRNQNVQWKSQNNIRGKTHLCSVTWTDPKNQHLHLSLFHCCNAGNSRVRRTADSSHTYTAAPFLNFMFVFQEWSVTLMRLCFHCHDKRFAFVVFLNSKKTPPSHPHWFSCLMIKSLPVHAVATWVSATEYIEKCFPERKLNCQGMCG